MTATEDERPVIEALVRELKAKQYLGDGAYIHHDGYHVWLTTSDGTRDTNAIGLEPTVLTALLRELDRMKKLVAEINRLTEKAAVAAKGGG